MEFFPISKTIKLRSHNRKYLIAADDRKTVHQSENSSSRRSRWVVELVDDNPNLIRLRSSHGRYLAASNSVFLSGLTGKKVVQAEVGAANYVSMGWEPVKDGVQVKLKAFGGTFLRGNGGPPPWKDSVTHDKPRIDSTKNWICWSVEVVDLLEDEEEVNNLITYLVKSFKLTVKKSLFLEIILDQNLCGK